MLVVQAADEHDRIAGLGVGAGTGHRLLTQRAVAGFVGVVRTGRVLQAALLPGGVLHHLLGMVARHVFHLHVAAELRAQRQQRRFLVQRLDLGAAAAVGVHAIGVGADDKQSCHAIGVQRQQPVVVLEQHHGLTRHIQCRLQVIERGISPGFADGAGAVTVRQHMQRVHDAQHVKHLAVHILLGDLASRDRLLQWVGEIVVVEVGGHRHLHVEPDLGALLGALDAAPVGDGEAVEIPLVTQHVVEQPAVLAAAHTVDQVVRAHHAQHARTLDRGLEGGQVQFTQRAIADRLVHVQAVGLLAVRGEMLGAGRHVGFLHALDVADGLLGGEHRVLAHVFEVAAAQRAALDVDRGPQDHVLAAASRLLAQRHAGRIGQVGVPGGGKRRAGGQVGHVVARVVQRHP